MKKTITLLVALAGFIPVFAQPYHVLENDRIKAEFNLGNGALVGLEDKVSGWDVVRRPELGQSFRMLIPKDSIGMDIKDERRYNLADGVSQPTAPEVETDGKSVTFTWHRISSTHLDNLDITFRATARLNEDGLVFSGEIVNNSDYVVEYVAWPFLGEVSVPDRNKDFWLETKNSVKSLYPVYVNDCGYWGVFYSTKIKILPYDGYFLMHNDDLGMMISEETPGDKEMICGMFELIPGAEIADRWPAEDEMDGQKVRMQASVNHYSYVKPGEAYRMSPAIVRLYKGGVEDGLAYYRDRIPAPNSTDNWAAGIRPWRRVTLSSPFQLGEYARQCAEAGVGTLIVRNWNRSVPYTLMEVLPGMARSIKEAHDAGCRVVLEGEFFRADPAGAKYGELKNYLQTDPYGFPYDNSVMCPMSRKLNELIRTDYPMVYSESLGADGFICSDQNSSWRTIYCFSADHGHRSPEFIGNGIADLDRQFAEDARSANPDYLVGGRYDTDAEADIFDFIYLPYCPRNTTVRFLNPKANIVSAINMKYAREDINSCVLNRFSICYDNLYGENDLTGYPNVVAYAKAVDNMRERYSDYIWNADLIPADCITADNDALTYACYKSRVNGKRAVVIVNHDRRSPATVNVSLSGAAGMCAVSPENIEPVNTSGAVTVPQLSVMVLLEK